MKVNLKSISKDLNISPGTISRVLNGKAKEFRISDATVKKVTEYAQKVGYSPNLLAKSLQASKSFTIGLILPDISNPFFSMMAKHIEKEASQKKYSILLMDSDENIIKEETAVKNLSDRKVDGMILCPIGNKKSHYEKLLNKVHCPIMFVDRYIKDLDIPFVTTNNYQGSYEATRFLIENGHTKIGIIRGDNKLATVSERENGYLSALKDAHLLIEKQYIIGEAFSEENGYLSLKKLMALAEKPTAILCLSNQICFGLLKAAMELKLSLPNDLSVISFDDNPYAQFISPALTTVKQFNDKMGKEAFGLLFKMIDNKKIVNHKVKINTELVIRKSVIEK